jgi:hypothetical protein
MIVRSVHNGWKLVYSSGESHKHFILSPNSDIIHLQDGTFQTLLKSKIIALVYMNDVHQQYALTKSGKELAGRLR